MSIRNILLFSAPFIWIVSCLALGILVSVGLGVGLFLGVILSAFLAWIGAALVDDFGD